MNAINQDFFNWLVKTRRQLHMHPEICYKEFETTRLISEVLTELGLDVRLFENMTGAIGLINGREKGKTVALRADIDALRVNELSDVPYKSKQAGLMHACGHDAHTTIMLGVARKLAESGAAETLRGNVKFLFQPAEEGGAGAREMINRGALEDPGVDYVLACHMLPELEVGRVGIYEGQSHASADMFELEIVGVGTHGGRPHQGYDPIMAGAFWLTAAQTIVSRNIDPLDSAVITAGQFHAGQAPNVIPEKAVINGTIRAIGDGVREQLINRLEEVGRGVEAAFNVKCRLKMLEGYPQCVNDPHLAEIIYNTAADLFGRENAVYLRPSTGAEDFSFFAQQKPSSIIRLGCGTPGERFNPLHSPYFDVDEKVLEIGVRLFTETVRRILS